MRHFYLSVMRVPRNYAYFVARTGFVATIKKIVLLCSRRLNQFEFMQPVGGQSTVLATKISQ